MPKERFHMLLAEQAMKTAFCASAGKVRVHDQTSFLLGAIMPDTFFYDIPRFTLSRLGRLIHRVQGSAGERICRRRWVRAADRKDLSQAAWLMGTMTHFIADGFWHGLVAYYSEPPFEPCRVYRLKPGTCHFWLEGQLEAQWIPLLGPGDGYRDFLKRIYRDLWRSHPAPRYYRSLIARILPKHVPSEKSIRRCLFWQGVLLDFFSDSRTDRLHDSLIQTRWGRYLGSLVVPREARLAQLMEGVAARNPPNGLALFDGRLLARSVWRLAIALGENLSVLRELRNID